MRPSERSRAFRHGRGQASGRTPRLEHAARNPYVRLAALLAGLFVFGWLVYGLRAVLTPVFLSFLIAYLLDPVVDWFERRRVNRSAAILILLFALAVGGSLMLLFVGLAVRDLREVVESAPVWLQDQVLPWLRGPASAWVSTTFNVDLDFEGIVEALRDQGRELAPRLAGPVQTIISSALSGTLALVGWVANALLVPLFSFYLLRDFDRITAAVRGLVPPRYRVSFVQTFREIDTTLAAFVRGQLMVMLILGVLYGLGLTIFQVKLGMGIGLLAGLLAVVPYMGFAVGIGMALVMSLMGGEHIWLNLIGTGVTFGVVQALEGTVITPKVVGDKVGLHPVWVIVALMVGAQVLGVLGMLLAVPAAAVVKILLKRARAGYETSELFLHPDDPPEDQVPAEPAERGGLEDRPKASEPPAAAAARAEAPGPPEPSGPAGLLPVGPAPTDDEESGAEAPPSPSDGAPGAAIEDGAAPSAASEQPEGEDPSGMN